MDYKSTVNITDDNIQSEENFLRSLTSCLEQELKRGFTIIGPHLDDIIISINGYDTRRFSSQGQKRTAALALKMGELGLFKLKSNVNPIVLLDDVFSELDPDRKKNLLDFLAEKAGQCFITTATETNSLTARVEQDYRIFNIQQGRAT